MLNILEYNNNQIRVIEKDGEYYWVAGDVCKILKLSNITKALERVDEDDLTKSKVMDKTGREQQSYIVNESGLYSLILTSEKEEAKIFKRWITKEVLPTLRKTGKYEINPVVSKNTITQKQLNEINLNDFDNYQFYYMNDILLSFPYFRYKINQDTGFPLINIEDYAKCVGFKSYSLYLLEKDLKNNKEAIEFSKLYDITCNKLFKEYLEQFRQAFKKARELKILEDLNNPCIVEDEREYNSTLYIEDYKNLIGTERLYTATEIGSVLGISSLMVGKIANKLKLKNEKFGAWFKDKASHSIKEVQTFKYNKNVINELKEYLKLNNANTLTI